MRRIRGALGLLTGVLTCSLTGARGATVTSSVLYQMAIPAGLTASPYGFEEAAGGQTVSGGYSPSQQTLHPLLWSGSSAAIDLLPTQLNITSGSAGSTNGAQQVGSGSGSGTSNHSHALLWNGSALSAKDLNPAGVTSSAAMGTDGTHQVGQGDEHAYLWTGSAGTAIDLNPTGFSGSIARSVSGNQQVGQGGGSKTSSNTHALLWNGSADSVVDLNPTNLAGFVTSYANFTNGSQQVGQGEGSSNVFHALLWNGRADTAVDLQPTKLVGLVSSFGEGTNGTIQVGSGYFSTGGSNVMHALMWTGTANSGVDLQSLLPTSGSWTSSAAYSVDAAGTIYGIANGTYNGATGAFAVEWLVPEPTGLALIILAAPLLTRRRAALCRA